MKEKKNTKEVNISNRILILMCTVITLMTLTFCVWLPAIYNTALDTEKDTTHYITYKSTTLKELKALDGKRICVTGFFSLASPYDNSWMYLTCRPLSSYPTYTSDTTLGESITCFPRVGQRLEYTENCVAVTGTLVYEPVVDAQEFSYEFYLKNCTYKTLSTGSDAIVKYNTAINAGAVKYLDELLAKFNTALTSTDEFTPFDVEVMKLEWKKYCDQNIDADLIVTGEKGNEMAEAINTFKKLEGGTTDSDEYKEILTKNQEMIDYMNSWIQSCEVKGNEYHEA